MISRSQRPNELYHKDVLFVLRGALAILFALTVGAVLILSTPEKAIYVFAYFAIADGVVAIVASLRSEGWASLRRTALLAEGVIACGTGMFLLLVGHNLTILTFGIAANAIIGGALGSVYSYGDTNRSGANWWALYGIVGVLLGFAAPPLMATGVAGLLISVAIAVAIQGVARIFLRGDSAVH
jgi:uncharacterized membrane protein HdeD (DUF308 family)